MTQDAFGGNRLLWGAVAGAAASTSSSVSAIPSGSKAASGARPPSDAEPTVLFVAEMTAGKAQVIVVAHVSDQAPDARLLEDSLDQLRANLDAIDTQLGEGTVLLGDAGYLSGHNVQVAEIHGLDPYLATGRFKHSEPPTPAPRGPVPEHATPKQLMARKLAKKNGRALYARRKAIVEPVFGQIDTVQNGRELRLRGKPAARAQWRFTCAIHNLLKLHRNGGLVFIPTG